MHLLSAVVNSSSSKSMLWIVYITIMIFEWNNRVQKKGKKKQRIKNCMLSEGESWKRFEQSGYAILW